MIGKQGVSLLIGHNGVQDKTTLDAANETVARGIYDATTLSTIDAELATANIKNGITIFGFAGDADVHDISDATAIEAEVIAGETFYAASGGIRTGTMPIEALDPALNEYPAGYHAGAATLTTVDAQLVTGSIKFGITIFGVAGHTNVRDVSDADAVVGEVKTGSTFYAVGGARKTGTGTKTLSDANETVAAGYYAATTLSAVDAHLAAANILSGVTIFGFTGPATVQEIGAADAVLADVKNGKTFFSVTGGIKTGNLATVALNPALNEYPAGYHAGEASLTAVDGDLAAGNIKNGVVIFGVTGTFEPTLIDDTEGSNDSDVTGTQLTNGVYRNTNDVSEVGDGTTLATKTLTFAAGSRAVVVGVAHMATTDANTVKCKLFAGGVEVAESGFVPDYDVATETIILTHIGGLSGEQICKITAFAYTSNDFEVVCGWQDGSPFPAGIGIGSIKT